METRAVGVFALRDVHAGAVKRVAAVVRKGAQIVATLHSLIAAPSGSPGGGGNHHTLVVD